MTIEFVPVDFSKPSHAADLIQLLDEYATDPMGGNEPLSADTKRNLPEALAGLSNARSILCYVEGRPAGLANCFLGFSTFKCRPVLNIHDLCVSPQFRGQQLSQLLLEAVAALASNLGCCKITLEVLEGNKPARNAYIKFGFSGYQLDPALGHALFWEKPID